VDPSKDQSYALHVLNQEQLARALFPLGEMTKQETREHARRFGLRIAEKQESQDLCFIADGNYRNFLRRRIPNVLQPGNIVDRRGQVLGRHAGLANYTIGQRKGLGVALGEPLYVLALDGARNEVVVGRAEELGQREFTVGRVNWISGQVPEGETRVTVKIRYRAAECPATLSRVPSELPASPMEGAARARPDVCVVLDRPLRDITPGQAAVFYDGEVCLGGGIIR
jgi:tRNA-specific 2-thiouridylase